MLGSCFTQNVSSRMRDLGYEVMANPAGITYNPVSILTTINTLRKPDSLHSKPLFYQDGIFSHPDFHGSFSSTSDQDCLERCEKSLGFTRDFIRNVSYFTITLGTCWVYRHLQTDHIVNNCHKQPSQEFRKELLSLEATQNTLESIREGLLDLVEEDIDIIFTVSPVRHLRNGMVADKKSKATALMAIHHMVDAYEDCHYFPAYEIQVDDLRDYRYYDKDLLHPSEVAVEYIFDQFSETFLDKTEADLRGEILSLNQRRSHRLLHPESPTSQVFLEKLQADINQFRTKHPIIADRLFK